MKYILQFILIFFFLFVAPREMYAYSPVGNYLEVNGGYVKTSNTSQTTPNAVSFEVWVYPVNTSGEQVIVTLGTQNVNPKRYEISRNGNSLQLRYQSGLSSLRLISAGFIPEDTWSHVAVFIASNATKLFINGAAVYTYTGTAVPLPLGPDILVGNSLKGNLDELRISTNERDVSALWNSGAYDASLTNDSSTYLLWHFDETRGQKTAHDGSGNGRNGSLVGSDSKIHFGGELASSPSFVLPTIGLRRPLPTLSFPMPRSGNDNNDDEPASAQTFPPFPFPTLRFRFPR